MFSLVSSTPRHAVAGDRTPPRRGIRNAALTGAALVVLLAGLVRLGGSDRRAIQHLDAATRAGLVERALVDLRTACARTEGSEPAEWCRERAEFVLTLDECDAACRATAHEVLRAPTR